MNPGRFSILTLILIMKVVIIKESNSPNFYAQLMSQMEGGPERQ